MSSEVQDLTVLALRPEQMRPAQEALIAWVRDRMIGIDNDLREQERALAEATQLPFSNQSAQWRRELGKTRRLLTYYEKIHDALQAGYIIVPDFPIDVFAIRTAATSPVGEHTFSDQWRRTGVFPQRAQVLPAGEGANVAPLPTEKHEDLALADKAGKLVASRKYWADEFRDVEIPARLVRPEILNATNKALALRIFDEIGLVGQPKRDPIIVGKIIDPRDRYHQRKVAFFIAWWLDTKSL